MEISLKTAEKEWSRICYFENPYLSSSVGSTKITV